MVIEQLCQEIRYKLRLHKCNHKVCDCHRARELLLTLEALLRVKYPWHLEITTACETRDADDEF